MLIGMLKVSTSLKNPILKRITFKVIDASLGHTRDSIMTRKKLRCSLKKLRKENMVVRKDYHDDAKKRMTFKQK